MVFCQCGGPEVQVTDVYGGVLERLLDIWVGRDVGEALHRSQAVRVAHRVVVAEAVIAAPLKIQSCQVEGDVVWLALEEVPDFVDDLRVNFLGLLSSEAAQNFGDVLTVVERRAQERTCRADLL